MVMVETLHIPPETVSVLSAIHGQAIENSLIELAHIGGTRIPGIPELPERYSVNRMSLTENDLVSRTHLRAEMEAVGMITVEHPLGVIGVYTGTHPELPAIGMMSHTDSVPEAGMYDGDTGVISSIQIVKALYDQGIRLPHSIFVFAFTGEEVARFNRSLFASAALFKGLDEKDLNSSKPGDMTIAEAVEKAGFNPQLLTRPIFGPKEIGAMVEFHVAQDTTIPEGVGIVESIAAAERYRATIGETALIPDTTPYPEARYFQINVQGNAGHSGATPMGSEFRADGLVEMASIVSDIPKLQRLIQTHGFSAEITMGDITVNSESLNKIPGQTSMLIRIHDKDRREAEKFITAYLNEKNRELATKAPQFRTNAITLEKMTGKQIRHSFYKKEDMLPRQLAAAEVIREVHRTAIEYGQKSIVGTVGTYTVQEGKILLGVDIRGNSLPIRDDAVEKIQQNIFTTIEHQHLSPVFFGNPLAGSGEPVVMDPHLVQMAEQLVKQLGIAPYRITYSRAGHDAQNAARALIPTVMIFCSSRHGGIAHTPEEYSTPNDLEIGAKSMAALVIQLASQTT